MSTACPVPSLPLRFETAAPVRSPRTSIVLAALARQCRLERRQRRLKRQRRRQAWARVTAWLDALSRWPFRAMRMRPAPGLRFPPGGAACLRLASVVGWVLPEAAMTSPPSTASGKSLGSLTAS